MPIPVIIPILTSVIPAAIQSLKMLFGGGGPPYIERLAQQAIPLANETGIPALAFLDAESGNGYLMAFMPDGSHQNMGSGANAATVPSMVGNAVAQLGQCWMITRISPAFEYHMVGEGQTPSIEGSVDATLGEILGYNTPGVPSSGVSSNWIYWAAGAVVVYLIIKRR